MKKRILLVCALAAGVASFNAQRWEPASQKTSEIRKEVDVKYSYRVDLQSLRNILKDAVETGKGAAPVIISLPTAEGKIEKFAVYNNPVLEKSLADRYQLGSYMGVGVDDPSKYLTLSTSPTEMQSMIIKDGVFQFIEPISANKQTYGVFYKTNKTSGEHGFDCSTDGRQLDIKTLEAHGKKNLSNLGLTNRPSSTKFRTYRLALSVTGEYTTYFGGTAGAVAQINNTMTRVNGVFQKDFGIQLNVLDLPNLIYTNAGTDPYSNSDDMGNWNLELQETLTQQVTNAGYDIGHLFGATGGGGNAGCIGCICVNPTTNNPRGKGSGYTSPQDGIPSGDNFDIDYVAHEMGHQLGGNHTFSNSTESSGANVEPGGGTTIMGYAGITQDNVQQHSNAYFHYKSIDQIMTNLEGKTTCGTSQNITVNTPPVIAALTPYTIPKGTAYYLQASATDADALNYTWEQNDSVGDTSSISGDSGWGYNAEGAISRSVQGTASGTRYFPRLSSVMNGVLTDKTNWETVSYIPRVLKYALTVRDANAQRPMLSSDEVNITVGNDGPFKFNGLTSASVLYNNASNTIYWDVANTNAAPYNVANVKIDYTTNNGNTWTDLVASTPNTGSYAVQMPGNLTGAVKLRISALNSIFYAVSPAITVGTAPTSSTAAPTGVSALDAEIFKTTARVSWNNVPGATYLINYRKVGTTAWSNATSTTNSVVLNNLEDEMNYEAQVAAVVNSVPGTYSSNYTFKTKGLRTGVDYCLMTTGGNNMNSEFYSALLGFSLSNLNHQEGTNLPAISKTYVDYSANTNKLINLVKGTQYTLNFTNYANRAGGYEDWFQAWIDFNRNGVFEDSEKIGSANDLPDNTGYHEGSLTFTVPADAYSGHKLLRMRVASSFYIEPDGACGSPAIPVGPNEFLSVGSFRDFPVKITSGLAVDETKNPKASEISIYPNPADTFVEVKNLKGKADYKIYSADGRLVQEGAIDGQRINVASLIKGMYVITIKDDKNTYNTKLIKK